VILLDNIIEVLNTPQLRVTGKNLLLDRSRECLGVGGVLIRPYGEWEPSMVGSQLLKEAICRGNVTFGTEQDMSSPSLAQAKTHLLRVHNGIG
jgi:hypothetical protein